MGMQEPRGQQTTNPVVIGRAGQKTNWAQAPACCKHPARAPALIKPEHGRTGQTGKGRDSAEMQAEREVTGKQNTRPNGSEAECAIETAVDATRGGA
ncbi:hypothetical protein THAOC_17663 [Thalassiosira oceanica]|uniref:Uncharacterized protein n=1 Tax=Thalassiosira oceanica TaxID=159749 RepID=K0SU78_THAOC|nr:hypothetical protein THAOC_17663 [Thalassiosira oceanica]|eukprot:EJK61787.1 hypothetical protein THAOC_17663 [Thalassiosira oceanica]